MMKIPPIVLWLVIVANAVMFAYIMIYIPYTCRNLAVASSGTAVCGLSIGAYFIAIANCVVVTAAALMLIHE
ncbi:MAG TPA: hypothetical protein PK272_02280 [Methanoregulaceae archaeon]|nr:hypothetical protein [Methanoregulaceae archaeon]HNL85716.1 hypothetical protein [Methanoregulaceae archaeon]HNO07718.1 hypothetical protein [Methanoregulaceae archaeon]